jgi:hypothetical protein
MQRIGQRRGQDKQDISQKDQVTQQTSKGQATCEQTQTEETQSTRWRLSNR